MSRNGDARFRRLVASLPPLQRPPEPRPERRCVFCGHKCKGRLTCRYCKYLLALDGTYAEADGRMDETDYLPETDEYGR